MAFVPGPLPDELPLDARTVSQLAETEHAVGRLEGAAAGLLNPYLVGSPLLHREAIASSRIEGIYTTPEQLVLLEIGGGESDDERLRQDTREVRNYLRAMEHGLASPLPLSLRLVRELHGVLLADVRGGADQPGEFRTMQNYIGRPGEPIDRARFVPPPVAEMRGCLDALERRLHATEERLPVLVRLALVHYQFEAIHPFRDGNGRIGRLLSALMLVREGRLSRPLLYLSAYIERHRDEYMNLLLAVSQRGAWLPWVGFFLDAVRESAAEGIEQARALLDLRDGYHDRVRGARSFGLLQRLIDDLFITPSTTIGRVGKTLGVTPATASANIRKLLAAGILREVTGRKRDQLFIAPDVLAFMVNRGASDGLPAES